MSSQRQAPFERKGNQLPGRLQCSICSTFKGTDQFSKKELKNAQWLHSSGASMKGKSAGVRCTRCTGTQRQELQCLKCGDTLELAKFSKTSKKAGGNQWCIECTMYKESAIPDSEQTEVASRAVAHQPDHRETKNEDGWVDMAASSAVMGRTSFAQPPSFAPGADAFAEQMSRMRLDNLRGSSSTNPPLNMEEYVPPHLRAKPTPAANGSVSSASNLYEDARSTATPTVAGTETEDDGWNPVVSQRKPFHAWGPQGQHQMRTTSGSSSAINTPGSTANTPVPTPPPVSAPAARVGGWARPVGNRTVAGTNGRGIGGATHGGFTAPQRKEYNNQYDSDESQDAP